MISCDAASSHLLFSSVVFSSQPMFLLLFQSLFFGHLLPLPCYPSYFPPLVSFVSISVFGFVPVLGWFFPGFHFLEHVGDKRGECVKEEGFGREM